MHIQAVTSKVQFITISNPIKEPRNYSLSSDNLLSAGAWSALRRRNGIQGYFEFQSGNSFYIYHMHVCPNENCWELCNSAEELVFLGCRLPFCTTASHSQAWHCYSIVAQKLLQTTKTVCFRWHFTAIRPDSRKVNDSTEWCKTSLPVFSLCVVVCSFQTCD